MLQVLATMGLMLLSVISFSGCGRKLDTAQLQAAEPGPIEEDTSRDPRLDPRLGVMKILKESDGLAGFDQFFEQPEEPSDVREDFNRVAPTDSKESNTIPGHSVAKSSLIVARVKEYTFDRGSNFDMTIHAGFSANFFDIVEISAKANFTTALESKKAVYFRKQVSAANEPFFVDGSAVIGVDDDGYPIKNKLLNVSENLGFLGQCIYSSNIQNVISLEGSLSLAGSGSSSHKEWYSGLNFRYRSAAFELKKNDSLRYIIDLCEVFFSDSVKNSIRKDVEDAMIAASYNDQNLSRRQIAIRSYLYGPDIQRFFVDGHHFNIKQVKIDHSTAKKVVVNGEISHSVHGEQDDSLVFKCTMQDRRNPIYEQKLFQKSTHKSWQNEGQKLMTDICHDAFLEFVQGL